MTGGAVDPGGSRGGRDPRSERAPATASFETARVGGRRGRQPVFILGFLVILAGTVAVGVGGRGAAAPSPDPFAAIASPGSSAGPTATVPPAATPRPSPTLDHAPIATSGPGPVQLLARRHPETLFVHGDVYVPRVTWVFLSLRDDTDRVTAWASVSVPGAAGPNAGTGPTLRFDVELPLPAEGSDGQIWIHADAYDADGTLVTTAILELDPA